MMSVCGGFPQLSVLSSVSSPYLMCWFGEVILATPTPVLFVRSCSSRRLSISKSSSIASGTLMYLSWSVFMSSRQSVCRFRERFSAITS